MMFEKKITWKTNDELFYSFKTAKLATTIKAKFYGLVSDTTLK